MEHKIGEIFEYNGEWYQCIIGHCNQCSFDEAGTCKFIGNPYCAYRNDKKLACFKKLEKVGQPYEFDGHLFQSYHTFEVPIFTENYATVREFGNNSKISIEIKQTKEDMEEKKQCGDNRFRAIARAKEHLFQATNIAEDKKELEVLDSFLLRCWQMGWLKQYEDAEESKPTLKPFDLEAAKAGKPVCTRDGRKARIICFDRKGYNMFPIVALIMNGDRESDIYTYRPNGTWDNSGNESEKDLMMLPEKKEGWINVYKERIYSTKEEAIEATYDGVTYIDTVKISWEE